MLYDIGGSMQSSGLQEGPRQVWLRLWPWRGIFMITIHYWIYHIHMCRSWYVCDIIPGRSHIEIKIQGCPERLCSTRCCLSKDTKECRTTHWMCETRLPQGINTARCVPYWSQYIVYSFRHFIHHFFCFGLMSNFTGCWRTIQSVPKCLFEWLRRKW